MGQSAVFLGRDVDFPIEQANFHVLNARLASEVLFHPVGSKVSGHALDAHFDVLDLGLRCRQENGTQQEQQGEFSCIHCFV